MPGRVRTAGVVVAMLLTGFLAGCGKDEPPVSGAPLHPCCHLLVAAFSPTTTTNRPARQALREGPEPVGAFTTVDAVPGTAAAFPAVDVAQAALLSDVNRALREAHELYVVGPNLGEPPPGGAVPGTIMYRNQDVNAAFGRFFPLSSLVPDPAGVGAGPLGSTTSRPTGFMRVGAAVVAHDLHVCAVDGFSRLNHAVRTRLPAADPSGSPITEPTRWAMGGNLVAIWDDIGLGGGGERGTFVDVACAGVTNPDTGEDELHVCAVTGDGRLWHSIRSTAGAYSPLTDIETMTGEAGDDFSRVACTGKDGRLFLVGVTKGGGAWLTIRTPTAWRPFADVRAGMSAPLMDLNPVQDIAIGFCDSGVPPDPPHDVSQLNIVLLGTNGELTHTLFTPASRQWSPVWPASSWMPAERLTDPSPGVYVGLAVAERPFLPSG